MVLKSAFAAALCTGLLMSGSVALADDYGGSEGDAFDALALLSTDDARVGWVTKSRT